MSDADLLVIGGGMAGLSAAAWSVRQGRSVVLVEKGALGGTAVQAGFIWTAPTYEVLREQVPDGDPALQRALIDGFEGGDRVGALAPDRVPAAPSRCFASGAATRQT